MLVATLIGWWVAALTGGGWCGPGWCR